MKQLARALSLISGNIAIDVVITKQKIESLYVNTIRSSHATNVVRVKTCDDTYASCVKRLAQHVGDALFTQHVDATFDDAYTMTDDDASWSLYPTEYAYGVHRNTRHTCGKQFELLVPLKIDDANDAFQTFDIEIRLPNYETRPKTTKNVELYTYESTLSQRALSKLHIDISQQNDVVKHFFNDLTSSIKNDVDKFTFIDLENGRASLFGLNVDDGVLTTRDASATLPEMLTRERFMIEFDSLLSNMHRNARMVAPQFINVRFLFDIDDLVGGTTLLETLDARRVNIIARVNDTTNVNDITLYDFDTSYYDDANVVKYLNDDLNVDLSYANKLNASIFKHALLRENDYVFNLYNGYANDITRTTKIKNHEETFKPMGVMRNAPIIVNDVALCSRESNSLSYFDVVRLGNTNADPRDAMNDVISSSMSQSSSHTFKNNTSFVNDVLYDKSKIIAQYNAMKNASLRDDDVESIRVVCVPTHNANATNNVSFDLIYNNKTIIIAIYVYNVNANVTIATLQNDAYTKHDDAFVLRYASFGIVARSFFDDVVIAPTKIVFNTRLVNTRHASTRLQTNERYATTCDDTIYLFRQMGALVPRLVERVSSNYDTMNDIYVKMRFNDTNAYAYTSTTMSRSKMCDVKSKKLLPAMTFPSIGYCNTSTMNVNDVLAYNVKHMYDYALFANTCVLNLPKRVVCAPIIGGVQGVDASTIREQFETHVIERIVKSNANLEIDKKQRDELFYKYTSSYTFEYIYDENNVLSNEHQKYTITFTLQ